MQQEVEKEERLDQIIREMRKERNKRRKPRTQNTDPASKRRKNGSETSSQAFTTWDNAAGVLQEDASNLGEPRNEKRKETHYLSSAKP